MDEELEDKQWELKYGSRSTCHRRLREWQDLGVWEQLHLNTYLRDSMSAWKLLGVELLAT
jgi:transposase